MKERLDDYIPDYNIKMMSKKDSNDEVERIKLMSEEEVYTYIRSRLLIGYDRLRFDMSGYDDYHVGENTVHNTYVLNRFAHLGIYDYMKYLTVDFYKGKPDIHFEFWVDRVGDQELYKNFHHHNSKLSGYSTTEIIYEIFKLTILSGREKRRR